MQAHDLAAQLDAVDAPDKPIKVGTGTWGSERRYRQQQLLDDAAAKSVGGGYELPDGSALCWTRPGEITPYESVHAMRRAEGPPTPRQPDVDQRTEAYLSAVADRLGLVLISTTEEGGLPKHLQEAAIDHQVVARYPHDADREILVYQYESIHGAGTTWAVETVHSDGIDAVWYVVRYLSRRPSQKDVETLFELERAGRLLRDPDGPPKLGYHRTVSTTYRCWECGCETHWLDATVAGEDDLASRLNRAEETYCGC